MTLRVAATASWRTVLPIVWVGVSLYVFLTLDRGWVPHDEGQFGQAAERVLHGEMPHRDFDEMYVGGLTYVNALAFYLFGPNSFLLRVILFCLFVGTIPALFYFVSRWCSPLASAAVTAAIGVWTLPNYAAPVPSWYNLFFAILGLAAVARYLEVESRRWLLVAGVCGGLSFLVKPIGLYYVAGVLLFLVFREQVLSSGARAAGRARWTIYRLLLTIGLVAFIAILGASVRHVLSVSGFLVLLLPSASVAVLLMRREVDISSESSVDRFKSLFRMLGPFLGGFILPIGPYIFLYWIGEGLGPLWAEVFVRSSRRLAFASYPMPPFNFAVVAPSLLLPVAILNGRPRLLTPSSRAAAAGFLAFVLVASAFLSVFYQLAWSLVVFGVPLSVVAAAWLSRRTVSVVSDRRHQQVVLTASVAAVCSLTVFPFPAPIYFCFVAPLAALVLVGAFWIRGRLTHPLAALLVVFYLLFGLFRVNPGFIHYMGRSYSPDRLTARLALPRSGGLRIAPSEAAIYERLIGVVRQHADGRRLYAFPDAPEVYFLSGLPNPTRTIYEFLSDPVPTDSDVLHLVDTGRIGVVAINTLPEFSRAPSDTLMAALRGRFPHGEIVGAFEVRWRE